MKRNAHSLIEMLVVLIIVSILIAIVVPAVQRSRESARQAQCIHNQGQLAKAVHMHVSDEPYGRYPGYRTFASDGTTVIGWAPQVFEYLGKSDMPEDPTQAKYIEVLVCPSNQTTKDMPRLNYVVNGGQAGADSPADGIFFDHAKDEKIFITKDDFGDGLTNTILLAENLDATQWNATDEASQCILWPLTDGNEINNGEGARPSSHHPGGFVAAFADGSVKFMSESELNEDPAVHTDGSIYVAYLTPGGDDQEPLIYEGPGPDPCNEEELDSELDEGLDWIARHQFDDGSWNFNHSQHPDCNGSCDTSGSESSRITAATGLALLPLIGSGNTLTAGTYREHVCKGVNYLIASQWPNGSLNISQSTVASYDHLFCHLALAEAYELAVLAGTQGCPYSSGGCDVDLDELRNAVQKAIDFTIATAYPHPHGWRYGGGGDVPMTTWAIAALHVSERAGLTVPSSIYDQTRIFLAWNAIGRNPVTDSGVTIFTDYDYMPNHWAGYRTEMTTCAHLAYIYMGVSPQHAGITQLANSMTTAQTTHWPIYGNMHKTHLKYFVGGQQWEDWNTEMRNYLLPLQATSGHARGSFAYPAGQIPSSGNSQGQGGRLAQTAMALLCLETYFTGLRLYEE